MYNNIIAVPGSFRFWDLILLVGVSVRHSSFSTSTPCSLAYCLMICPPQWRIQDFWKGGSNTLLRAKRARIFRSHAHFWTNHAHFRSFLRQSTSSTSPIDLFSNEFLLKHSKVSHSSSFLSSVARKGGSIYLSSVYFLVLGVAKRGVPVHPWIPLWIRHCSILVSNTMASCKLTPINFCG